MSLKKAGDTPLLSQFAQDNVVILHSRCGGGQNLTVLDGEVAGEKDRQDAKAQFRVHVRRPAVVALQNVHNSDWWLAVYKKKTTGSGRGGPYCDFKIKEIEGKVSLESVKYKGYYLGVKPDGSGSDTHFLFTPYLVRPPRPHSVVVSHQQNSPPQCYPPAGYPQPGYSTPHSQHPSAPPQPHHGYPQPYPQGYPPQHPPPPQQHRQSYPQLQPAPSAPPHPQGYQPHHPAPGPPQQHCYSYPQLQLAPSAPPHPQGYQPHHSAPGPPPYSQGYQPHHPGPGPPQQHRHSYPQLQPAPSTPPHSQGYQPRHPAPGPPPPGPPPLGPPPHSQGYQPCHPAPGPPPPGPPPHSQGYQPRHPAPGPPPPGPPPHSQGYQPRHPAPGPPPHSQGYQPRHPAPGPPPHSQGYQPRHPAPGPPPHSQGYQPRHPAPGPPPHSQGYQPRHPAPGPPPQPHPQNYQPHKAAPGVPPRPHHPAHASQPYPAISQQPVLVPSQPQLPVYQQPQSSAPKLVSPSQAPVQPHPGYPLPAITSIPATSSSPQPPTTIAPSHTQATSPTSSGHPDMKHGTTPTKPPVFLPTTSSSPQLPNSLSPLHTQPQDQGVTTPTDTNTTLPTTRHGVPPTESPIVSSLPTTSPPTTISLPPTQLEVTQNGATPTQPRKSLDVTSPSKTRPLSQPSPSTESTHSPLPESFIKSLKEQLTFPLTADPKSISGASAKPRGLSEELQKETWYHKGASKETAEELLNKSVNGSFLVRDGESAAEVCSLSLKYPGGIKHFRILKTPSGLYRVLGSRGFQTIPELIDYFTQHSITVDPYHKLRFPCPRPSTNDDDVDAPDSAPKLRGRRHTLPPEPASFPVEDQPTAAPAGYDILNLFQSGNILRLIPRADPSALPIYVASKKLHGKGTYHSADSEFLVTVPSHGLVMLSNMQWSNNYLCINKNGKIKADGKEKDDACCFYLFATEDGKSILLESQKFRGWYLAVGIGGEVADPKTLGPGSRETHFAVRAEKILTPHFHVLTTRFQDGHSVANKLNDRCTIQLFCKRVGMYLSISSSKKAVVEGCRDQDDQHTFFVLHDRGMGIFSLYSYKNPSHMIRMHNNILQGKGDANRSADFYLKETPDGDVCFESFTCPGMYISVSNSVQVQGRHFSVSLLTVKHSGKVETIIKTPLSS